MEVSPRRLIHNIVLTNPAWTETPDGGEFLPRPEPSLVLSTSPSYLSTWDSQKNSLALGHGVGRVRELVQY